MSLLEEGEERRFSVFSKKKKKNKEEKLEQQEANRFRNKRLKYFYSASQYTTKFVWMYELVSGWVNEY